MSSKMDGPRRGTLRGVIEKRRTLRLVLTPLHPCPHFPVSQLSVIGLPRLLWLSLQIHPDEILPLPLALTPSCSEPLPPSIFQQKGRCNCWAALRLNYLERYISGCFSSRWLPVFKLPVSSLLACCTLQRLSNSPSKSMNPKLTRVVAAFPITSLSLSFSLCVSPPPPSHSTHCAAEIIKKHL